MPANWRRTDNEAITLIPSADKAACSVIIPQKGATKCCQSCDCGCHGELSVWSKGMFLSFGVAHSLLFDFVFATTFIINTYVFPGSDWTFVYSRFRAFSEVSGFLFSTAFNEKLSFFVAIGMGYIAMAVSSATLAIVVFTLPRTNIGLYFAYSLVYIYGFFAAITRSKVTSVSFNVSQTASWLEMQGLGLGGMFANTISLTLVLFSAGTPSAEESAAIVCFLLVATVNLCCSFLSQPLKNLQGASRGQCSARNLLASFSESLVYGSVTDTESGRLKFSPPNAASRPLLALIWACKRDLLGCLLVLMTTYLLFPGVPLSWAPPATWSANYFSLYITFLLQIGDLFGRCMSKFPVPRNSVLPISLARVCLIPLFTLCLHYPDSAIFGSLAFQTILVLVFCTGNGYCFGITTAHASHEAKSPTEITRISPVIGFTYLFGLLIGTMCCRAAL
eukprot:Lankesteria_metandrocarpae@DN3626_c0_g1_i2.p2